MSIRHRILWLDNDPAYVYPFVVAMKDQQIDADVVRTVSEAEERLGDAYDAVIIDVMIPVTEQEETTRGYGGEVTDDSHRTGLEFYQRVSRRLLERDIVAIVMTVRVDKQIRDEFLAAGLPATNFIMKMELRDARSFVERMEQLLKARVQRTDG